MKTAYIHIGLAKTGTSFLQSVFAYNADLYRALGLSYPDLCNNFSVAAKGGTTTGNALPVAAADLPALSHLEKILNPQELLNVLDGDFNHLLSSEWLSGCRRAYLETLRQVLSQRFSVRFIAVVRDPAEHIVSTYQEGLKNTTYKHSVETHLDELIGGCRKLYRLLLDIGESLHLINYDFNRDDLIGRIDNIVFGQRVSAIPSIDSVNPSPSAHQTTILQIANQLAISDVVSARRYIKQTHAASDPKYVLPDHLAARVFEELEGEIREINGLLPENEPIIRRRNQTPADISEAFRPADAEFLSELIQRRIARERQRDLAFLANWTSHPKTVQEKLPEDFDLLGYLIHNPDLIAARVNPIEHYLTFGEKEGRRYR